MFVASIYPEKMCSEAAKAYVCQTTSSWFTPVFSIKKNNPTTFCSRMSRQLDISLKYILPKYL